MLGPDISIFGSQSPIMFLLWSQSPLVLGPDGRKNKKPPPSKSMMRAKPTPRRHPACVRYEYVQHRYVGSQLVDKKYKDVLLDDDYYLDEDEEEEMEEDDLSDEQEHYDDEYAAEYDPYYEDGYQY